MSLAPYYGRAALAAAQVLQGFEPETFKARLMENPVGISVDKADLSTFEGRVTTEMLVRLLARLYPMVCLFDAADTFEGLARSINPEIELDQRDPAFVLSVGKAARAQGRVIYAGSDGWSAFLSTRRPLEVHDTTNPFGAALAATLAAGKLFRSVFPTGADSWEEEGSLSALEREGDSLLPDPGDRVFDSRIAVVGAGAIGNAAIWALSKLDARGRVHLVDHEQVELSNLQRYVLTDMSDVGRSKVELAAAVLGGGIEPVPAGSEWRSFVESEGYEWDLVGSAVDSAHARREIQVSLPKSVINSWTQPGDLGVSVHRDFMQGACLSCLYLPKGKAPNEDQLVARALGIPGAQNELAIRGLLFSNSPPPMGLLEDVSGALKVPMERLLPYAGRPLRDLYSVGICGGDILPVAAAGRPPQDLHVPLAHQSAMAGVLLAAALVGHVLGASPSSTSVTRLNVLRPVPSFPYQKANKDPRGICICHDDDYKTAYSKKYQVT